MNEVAIIQGAREILSDPKRWRKGSFGFIGEAVCALGALGVAATGTVQGCYSVHHAHPLSKALALVDDHVPGGVTIQEYNDAIGTTHADILNLFDKTLASLGGLA